ncbi:YceI family protein [Niabella beijingensis]|uniref:YceI family protein n=1 Tax=Niabella beijingensis TaxID=2872700 RepID=UPI001CBE160E|nr:YceI family protein [Niabella beijingensis]MBZ4189447.1 YceI family protein [Niabella beijingensis]
MAKTKWLSDLTHSELGFKIRHLMISNVTGAIRDFHIEVETPGEDFSNAQIRLTAKMDSISTNNEQRDEHLRNADFFEVEKYPELEFVSTGIIRRDEESFDLRGDLTLKGVTRPVQLKVEHNGTTKDPWGNERAGFSVTGKIERSQWGISFNSVLETGGIALGEDVKIQSELELVKQAAGVPA